MRRSESSAAHESRTLPMQGLEATERLADARLVLGRYRLERRLGAGGFGVVWLAWDQKLEREVAVKAIPIEEGGGDRAEREARAAARLNHPGIVAVYELASDEHEVYLVSELVRGRTLGELVQAGAVADRDVARIGAVLCDALEHAHARGVIHRDVKPQNVMVVADPAVGAGFAKLADFGVAHLASGDPLTRTGDVVGTLAYMAPEQAEGAGVTPASDVYSLALTLYEAWTGYQPVRAGGLAATARRLGQPLPPLSGRRRDLPRGLCDLVDDALAIDPAERPTPAELRAGLVEAERELDEEGGLEEPATLRRVGLPAARRRAPLRATRRDRCSTSATPWPSPRWPMTCAPTRPTAWACSAAVAARSGSPRRSRAGWPRARRPEPPPGRCCGGRPRQPRIRRSLVSPDPRRRGRRGHGAPARAWAGPPPAWRCAGGWPPRPAGPAPRCSWPWRCWRCPCSSRAPGCSGRCPCSLRSWGRSPWGRRSWALPRSRPPPGAAPGSPPRAPCG